MVFDDAKYTEEAILKQAVLIENHSRDGSVLDAGCHCVEGKHLLALEGYSEEGQSIMQEQKKKEFLYHLGNLARALRRNMEADDWNINNVLKESGLNPHPRAFLPHGLTEIEKSHADVRSKLASCIRKVEISCCGSHTSDYSGCRCNPVAVCRAALQ